MIKKTIEVSLFLALIAVFQIFHLPQIITGIFVNSILIFIFLRLGLYYGVISCILSPTLGMLTGFLSPALYFSVPVIIFGNIVFVLLYKYLKKHRFFIRFFIPQLVKALFIYIGALIFLKVFNFNVPPNFFVAFFSFIQIITAIFGTILAEFMFKKIGLVGIS
ncbi:MAG: hypothetical protein M0R46_14210 [Candidatus Muirbacterium halophilum]|nr:hypothetical protein [Candidatus Muirbacterium halophilum]MCK9477075.1 hypothetical protein [Candidatus Muirbacterium halophilum]